MATRLIQIIPIVNLAPATPTVFLVDLNESGKRVLPDLVVKHPDLSIVYTTTQITVTNNGPAPLSFNLYLERIHTIPRQLGALPNLTPQPYEINSSGSSVIPGGSVLCGTYIGDQVVLGDASLGCDTFIVGGSLYVHGNLTSNGWDLDVDGDMQVRGYANFSGVPVGEAQGTVRIRGDLFMLSGELHPAPAEAPSLTVDGDWLGDAGGFDGTGLDGANGLTVVVNGDLIIGGLGLSGGSSTLALDAGNGGILFVQGNCQIDILIMDGGGSALPARHAGAGGNLAVAGNHKGTLSSNGGSALSIDAGNGGVGGIIHIVGDSVTAFCEVNGGACASNDPLAVSGIGGTVLIDGSLTGDGHFGLNGGFRAGTGVVGAVIPGGPDGGTLLVRGDMNVGDINADGGTNSYDPDANTNAGNGGRVECSGDIRIRNQALMRGGEVFFALGNGGNGGNITCAHLSVTEGNAGVFIPGGFAQATGINGAGGFVWVKTGLSVSSLRMLDGAGPGAAPTDLTYIILSGPCTIWELLMDDRGTDTQIRTEPQGPPVLLKVQALAPKNTLNAFDGTVVTGPIATPETQVFFTDVPGAVWLSTTGVVVP